MNIWRVFCKILLSQQSWDFLAVLPKYLNSSWHCSRQINLCCLIYMTICTVCWRMITPPYHSQTCRPCWMCHCLSNNEDWFEKKFRHPSWCLNQCWTCCSETNQEIWKIGTTSHELSWNNFTKKLNHLFWQPSRNFLRRYLYPQKLRAMPACLILALWVQLCRRPH